MRVSKQATVAWGIVQLAVALGAQLMDRSVLDAGLAGAVVRVRPGARRVSRRRAHRRVGARAMLAGMVAGIVVLAWAWWTGACAWTWYAFLGSAVTGLTALAVCSAVTKGGGEDRTPFELLGCSSARVLLRAARLCER